MLGRVLRAGQMWKKKPDNWSKVKKDLEELPSVNDFSAYFLLFTREDTLFLWLCTSALLLFCLNCFSVRSPTCCTVSLTINFVPVLAVFASLRNTAGVGGGWARARGILLLASSPGGLVARIPGFHPGSPGSKMGRAPCNFLDGPLVKTPSFPCRWHEFDPWSGNWDPACCTYHQKFLGREPRSHSKPLLSAISLGSVLFISI